MPDPELAQEIFKLHASLCSALADPRRILLLYEIAERPSCVNELAVRLGISQPAASRHLKILRENGLIDSSAQGSAVKYQLADPRVIQALDILRAVLYDRLVKQASLIGTSVSKSNPEKR